MHESKLDFSNFINTLKKINPWNFEFHFNSRWGSSSDNYRAIVRDELSRRYLFKSDVKNLEELPHPIKGSVSITHSNDLGAFIYCSDRSVGLDIEEQQRVSSSIAHRISTPAEKSLPVSPSLFWVAKEAAFKAARPVMPKVLSSIEILSVSELNDGVFRFKAQVKETATLLDGIAVENIILQNEKKLAIAVAWLKGQAL